MKLCYWCHTPIVFDHDAIVWVAAPGKVRDKVTCKDSPINQHQPPE